MKSLYFKRDCTPYLSYYREVAGFPPMDWSEWPRVVTREGARATRVCGPAGP